MAHTVFQNNAETTLTVTHTAAVTTLTVADATVFLNPGANQVGYLTVRRVLSGLKEVVSYTAAAGTTVTGVVRNVDPVQGGSALTFGIGDVVEQLIPKIVLDQFVQRQGDNGSGDNDITGDLTWADTAGPLIRNLAATELVATLHPNQADTGVGVGWKGTAEMALIAADANVLNIGNLGGTQFAELGRDGLGPATLVIHGGLDALNQKAILALRTNLETRWEFEKTATAESGSEVGSDFILRSADDTGVTLRQNMVIKRDTGLVTWTGSHTWSDANGPAIQDLTAASTTVSFAPDKADLTAGLTGGSGVVGLATAGVSRLEIAADGSSITLEDSDVWALAILGVIGPDLAPLGAVGDNEFIVGTGVGTFAFESGATALASMGAQTLDDVLTDLSALTAVADDEFIVGTGVGTYAHEGGATARTSMGVSYGKETIWVPAGAMSPTVTAGCAGISSLETTAGRPDLIHLAFDKDADEHCQFQVCFPKRWNLGTVTAQFFWTSSGGAVTTGVTWGISGVAVSNDATADVAYGTIVTVDDNMLSASEEVLVSAESGAITIAETPADDDLTFFRILRDIDDPNDDLGVDALLLGIKLFWTADAANDV